MTPAEAALREFARAHRLRISACNHNNSNVGETAFKQTKFKRNGLAITIYAADSLCACEIKLPDRAFGFAVNRPDRISLLDRPVAALRPVLKPLVFVGDAKHEPAVIRWARSKAHRELIGAFELTRRESLQVYINGMTAIVEAGKDLGAIVAAVVELAAHLPEAAPAAKVDCAGALPKDLRHLAKHFPKWAVSDDDERQERVSSASAAALARLRADVEPLSGRINAYLDSCSDPLPECAQRLGSLAELVAELGLEK